MTSGELLADEQVGEARDPGACEREFAHGDGAVHDDPLCERDGLLPAPG
jgi:hypothetical protein